MKEIGSWKARKRVFPLVVLSAELSLFLSFFIPILFFSLFECMCIDVFVSQQTEPSFVFLTYCTLLRRVKFQRRELEILTRSNRALLNAAEENQALLLEQQALQKEEREEERLKHQRELQAVVSYLLNEKERLLLPPHSSSSSSLLPSHLLTSDLVVQSSLQHRKEGKKAEEEERFNAPASAFKKNFLTEKTSFLSKEEIVEHYRNSDKSKIIDRHTEGVVNSIEKIYYDRNDINPQQHKGSLQAKLKNNERSAAPKISSSSFLPSSSSCTSYSSERDHFSSSHLSSLPSRIEPSPLLGRRSAEGGRQEETQRRGRSATRRSDLEEGNEEKQEEKDGVYEVVVEKGEVKQQGEESKRKKKITGKRDFGRDDRKTSPGYGVSSSFPNYPFFYRKEEGEEEQGLYGEESSRLSCKTPSSPSYREDRETKDKRGKYSYQTNERISSVSPADVRNERRRGKEEEEQGREISIENPIQRLGGEKKDSQDEEKKFVSPPFSSEHLLDEKRSIFYPHRQNSNEVKPSSSSSPSHHPSSYMFQRGIGKTTSSSSSSSSYGYTSLLREANESLQHELRLLREEKKACSASSSSSSPYYGRYGEPRGQPPSSHALPPYDQQPGSYHENADEGSASRRQDEEQLQPSSSFSSSSSSSSYAWMKGEAGGTSSSWVKAGYEEDREERRCRRKEEKDYEGAETCPVGGDTLAMSAKLPQNQSPEVSFSFFVCSSFC